MRVCWMFVIVLSCQVPPSRGTCPCNAGTEIIDVPCPNVTAAEMTFYLLKDQEIISNITCSHEKDTLLKCEALHSRADVDRHQDKQQQQQQQAAVSFRLAPTANRHGIYECEGTVIFPPPMIKVPSVMKIQVLEGHLCKCSKDRGNPGDDPSTRFVWIWIVVVALLTIYSITVTVIALINWVKLRNVDSHSDYINTKPRATWEHRKKRGVQKPIPRHF